MSASGFPRDLLQFAAAEEVVFLAAGALRALQAADDEHSHARRDHNGKDVSVGHKPMNQSVHTEEHHTANSKILLCRKAHSRQIELQSAGTRPEATTPAKVLNN
jgi:hypothetical protein